MPHITAMSPTQKAPRPREKKKQDLTAVGCAAEGLHDALLALLAFFSTGSAGAAGALVLRFLRSLPVEAMARGEGRVVKK